MVSKPWRYFSFNVKYIHGFTNTPNVYTNSACFSSIVCPIAGLQLSTGKLRIVDKHVLFNSSRRGLKESLNKLLTVREPQQTPYRNVLLEADFGKEFCTNARMPRGRKAFSFHL